MSYESKIFIVNRHNAIYTEIIAEYKASCMPYSFMDLFESEFDGKIYEEHFENKQTDVDCYGNKIRFTKDLNKLIDYLKKEEQREHYRRLNPLIGLLQGLNPDDWDDLMILHFGY